MTGRLLIRSGTLALPTGPMRGDLLCEGGRIVAIGRHLDAPDADVFDATNLTVGPGFIDVHVHGGGGHSFFTRDESRIAAYADWAPRNGVTSFLVSTVGTDADDTVAILEALAGAIGSGTGAEPLGFHLEGPFINPARHGAFPPDMLRAASSLEFESFQEAAQGCIRQVTLAPELDGALPLIRAVERSGAIAAMGHTDATTAECAEGFQAGVRHVTHLFNAMRPIHQREGGPAVSALLEEGATCEVICDGAHVAADLLRLAYRTLGPGRMVVVTDNLHLAGGGAVSGSFAGETVTVNGAARKADGTLVGSVATMDQHFRNVVDFLRVDLPTAFRLCATNPARVAGASSRKGRLERGFDADLILLDVDLNVSATVCRGQLVYQRGFEP